MLYLYTGTDRGKAREKMNADIEKAARGATIVRITDAHTLEDLAAALQGGGMFGGRRVLVFEGVCANEEMLPVFLQSLAGLAEAEEKSFVFEEKPLADLRKKLEKHAEKTERFDAAKEYADKGAFALANALQRRDKKALWVGYMREVSKGSAPEMLHGILFWAAKQQLLRNPKDERAKALVAELAELPHESRRRGFDFEYALEEFVLGNA